MAASGKSAVNPDLLYYSSQEVFAERRVMAEKMFAKPSSNKSKGVRNTHPKHHKIEHMKTDQNDNTTLQQLKKMKGKQNQKSETCQELDKIKKGDLSEDIHAKLQELDKMEREQNSHTKLQQLEKMKRQERLFIWHGISLARYLHMKWIPRGLRIQTGLEHVEAHPTITERWYATTNKCSFDLMTVTLKQAAKERERLSPGIVKLEKILKEQVGPELYCQMKRALDVKMATFEDNLMKNIGKKCKRDELDYLGNKVYNWKRQSGSARSGNSDFPWSSSDSDECANGQSSSAGHLSPSASRQVTEVKPQKKMRRGGRGRKKRSNQSYEE